ncbi:EBP2 [Candida pseudojiufengensis]|uniref:EBP2 n=1 Tax=Candida pseudojiufengensis TaxID=497109 RepID=UPI002224C370|nr:EBP2 [Candida pseudojiufengensis]KAI5966350.1 EBP2 [Candida pseudojiufengensis]
MSRGTLKQQLKSHKSKVKNDEPTNTNKAKKISSTKPKAQSKIQEDEETPIIPKPILKSPKSSSIKAKDNEYKSEALSKKEQRKLKKLSEQLAEEEANALNPEDAREHEVEEEEIEEESSEDEDDDVEGIADLDLERLAQSESESESDSDDDDVDEEEDEDEDEDDQDDEKDVDQLEEEEEDVPLSDVEYDSDADVVPHTKLTVNNTAALRESLARIQLPWEKHSFVEHQSITSPEKAESTIKDIYDDTERELSFYKQGLDAVKQARSILLKLKVPFSRPVDYFAEMVKSDEHMDKLKTKLLGEAADKKASEDAKKQRQLKKFGKQVQHETLQQRAKQKKETLEKIMSLKKKRGANEISNDDDFQIALEEATKENNNVGGDNKRRKVNGKRLAKNAKYGSGGMKRGSRKNDAASSADISGFSTRKMKGKSSRPGKSKRGRR